MSRNLDVNLKRAHDLVMAWS